MAQDERDVLPPLTREERLSFLLGIFCGAAVCGFVMLLTTSIGRPGVVLAVGWTLWIGCFLGAALTLVVLLNAQRGSNERS